MGGAGRSRGSLVDQRAGALVGEQFEHAAGRRLSQPFHQRLHRQHRGQAVASALLARRGTYRLPVCNAALGALLAVEAGVVRADKLAGGVGYLEVVAFPRPAGMKPVIDTFGVPVRFSADVPLLLIVKLRSAVPPVRATSPKSALVALKPIFGARPTP